MPGEEERLLTETQVAEYLNVALRTLRRWRQEGKGPPFLMLAGRYPRYRKADVDAWLSHQDDEQ